MTSEESYSTSTATFCSDDELSVSPLRRVLPARSQRGARLGALLEKVKEGSRYEKSLFSGLKIEESSESSSGDREDSLKNSSGNDSEYSASNSSAAYDSYDSDFDDEVRGVDRTLVQKNGLTNSSTSSDSGEPEREQKSKKERLDRIIQKRLKRKREEEKKGSRKTEKQSYFLGRNRDCQERKSSRYHTLAASVAAERWHTGNIREKHSDLKHKEPITQEKRLAHAAEVRELNINTLGDRNCDELEQSADEYLLKRRTKCDAQFSGRRNDILCSTKTKTWYKKCSSNTLITFPMSSEEYSSIYAHPKTADLVELGYVSWRNFDAIKFLNSLRMEKQSNNSETDHSRKNTEHTKYKYDGDQNSKEMYSLPYEIRVYLSGQYRDDFAARRVVDSPGQNNRNAYPTHHNESQATNKSKKIVTCTVHINSREWINNCMSKNSWNFFEHDIFFRYRDNRTGICYDTLSHFSVIRAVYDTVLAFWEKEGYPMSWEKTWGNQAVVLSSSELRFTLLPILLNVAVLCNKSVLLSKVS